MTELSVFVVEDEIAAQERLERLISRQPGFRPCGSAGDGISALRGIEELEPDIVLLDIQLPELGGFEILENLHEDLNPAVIFVTAYDEYAVRAFEVHAIDYVMKPVEPGRLAAALDRARAAIHNRTARVPVLAAQARSRVAIRTGHRILFLKLDEIESVEAAGNYMRIRRGEEHFLLRTTMASMEARLSNHKFVRIHRSKLINVDRIREIIREGRDHYSVVMLSGARMPLTRSGRRNIEDAMGGV